MNIVLLGGPSEVFIISSSRRGQVLVENLAASHSEEPGSGRGGACRRPSVPSLSPIPRHRGDSPGEAEVAWRRFWGARFESGARKLGEILCEILCDGLPENLKIHGQRYSG